MIPKGLKVGDTFTQGTAVFEVTGIDGEDYFCKRVGATPSFAEVDRPKKSVDTSRKTTIYLCHMHSLKSYVQKEDLTRQERKKT